VKTDPSDFSAVVKRKPAKSGSKWRWEIHPVGRSSPVKSSEYQFATMSEAKQAADMALASYRELALRDQP